jgi:hypothetical protein
MDPYPGTVQQEYMSEMAKLEQFKDALRPHIYQMIAGYNADTMVLKLAHLHELAALSALFGPENDQMNLALEGQANELAQRRRDFDKVLCDATNRE